MGPLGKKTILAVLLGMLFPAAPALPVAPAPLPAAALARSEARPGGAASSPSLSAEDARRIARGIVAGGSYQKKPVAERFPPQRWNSRTKKGIESFGSVFAILAYLAAGLALAFVALRVIVYLQDRKKTAASGPGSQTAAAGKEEKAAVDPQAAALERLAASGRFGEAVHAMLLAAVARLAEGADRSPPAALTSRELARLLPRTDEERGSFLRLVAAVEAFLFGGRPVSEETYARCREAFRRLAR